MAERTERKNGRKDRRVGGRRREDGKKKRGRAGMQNKSYPCTSGSSIFILVLFLFPKYLLVPYATQHPVPGLWMHQQKAVCEPLPMLVCFTGRHPPSPASTEPPVLGSQPQEDCTSWPRDESSGGRLGMSLRHHWPSTRSCSGRPSSLICAKVSHDMLSPPPSWAAHQGIGALRLHGVGAETCL